MKLSRLLTKMRFKDSRHKFLSGMAFEKSGMDLIGPTDCPIQNTKTKSYINSSFAQYLCKKVIDLIENHGMENYFYQLGDRIFGSIESEFDGAKKDELIALFGFEFNRLRYHHLVRLGGDIIASGLVDYHKNVRVGWLWYLSKTEEKI